MTGFSKKLLGLVLAATCTLGFSFANSSEVQAKAYTYRIKISLGNNAYTYLDSEEKANGEAYAYFDAAAVEGLRGTYQVSPESITKDTTEIEIQGLGFGDNVNNLDVDELIKIEPNKTTGQSKYYVAGLRVSGGNAIVTEATKSSDGQRQITATFNVTGDESYVVAYGVGQAISYDVKYVDESGNDLLPVDTFYAARGEIIYVPAKHVSGYYPDSYYRTASNGLKEDTTFTFTYKKYTGDIVQVNDVTYETTTTYGEPTYEYQYTNRGNNVDRQPGTTNNRGNAGGAGANGQNDNGQDGDGQDNQQFEDGQGVEEEIIADNEIPLDVIDIDDEETAKAAFGANNATRNMIVGIIIAVIAALSIILALTFAAKKKKKVAITSDKDEK